MPSLLEASTRICGYLRSATEAWNLSRWKPTPIQEQELYDAFIKTGKLNGVESSRAILLIQNKFQVKTSHAYNMLRHMKAKGWIATTPPRIQIVITAHYREATA